MKRSYLFLSLLTLLPIARAEYRIGDAAIPTARFQANVADFQVYSGHPRLFFRDTDLPAIRQRIGTDYRADWERLIAEIEKRALSQSPRALARHPYTKEWALPRNVVFAAVVTGDERYVRWAKDWALALAAAGPVGNDTEYRGRLQCLALTYDWLFAALSAEEKRILQQAILVHIERSWHFAAEATNYIGGHSRWGNSALAAGALALVTERPELREKVLALRRHWVDGYFPAQSWIAQDGGYHMGWAYSAAYLTASIHYVWSSATNECAFFPWQAKIPWFWIYGRQGDGTFPNVGDAYTVSDDLNAFHSDLLMIAAGVLKDRHAAWALKNPPDAFASILYGDKAVRPLAPEDAAVPLPLSCHFRNSGVVIARDRWDDRTTLLQFSSTPFFSTNHLHRDANAFTLHYRGGLAVDSGIYDEGGIGQGGYGGSHWRNYFTRTVAHNAITVFDPEQKMSVLDEPVANDGGQIFRRDPTKLEDILPGGHAHLDGITRYLEAAEFTYASGDATKAYDPKRVRLAQREIVYLRRSTRDHPVVVVFDRVESVRPTLQKRFLLHTVEEPRVEGNRIVAENRGGRLTCLTLLPEKATLEKIGGAGREAWVDGKNYPWDPTARKRMGRELAMWRVEVAPTGMRERDYFLHVFFVDDAAAKPVEEAGATLSRDANSARVAVAGWKLEFSFAAGAAARIERTR